MSDYEEEEEEGTKIRGPDDDDMIEEGKLQ